MSAATVHFFDAKPYDEKTFDAVNAEYGYAIKYYKAHLTPDTVALARGADAVCVFVNDVLNQAVIDALVDSGVKLVALRCAGYNNVDLLAAYGRMPILRVPAYSPNAVAEYAAALVLSMNRKTHRAYYRTRDNNFNINGLMGFDLYKKTVGVIGTGKIGMIFIGIMKGFGMRVLAYDPFRNADRAAAGGFEYVGLDTLYEQSDVISLHCPMTPENVHMVDEQSIEKMKEGVFIVNTGRGKLIDSYALIQGLKTGKIGAAGLDVYEEEDQYFFEDYSSEVMQDDALARLLSFPNVLLTSHQAFFTREAMDAIAHTTLNNIRDGLSGQRLETEVCQHCTDHPKRCERVHVHLNQIS